MLGLIYVNVLGKNSDREYVYEFYFSDEPEMVWGIDWDIKPSSICNLEPPEKRNYNFIKILKTDFILNVAQKNCCFSMQDCKDGIIPIAWENIDDAEEYPEDGRFVFKFGLDITETEIILMKRNLFFEGNENNDF